MDELDCRGLACPEPVVRTKALVDQGLDEVAVLVDSQASATNVTNFLISQGFEADSEARGPDFLINGRRVKEPPPKDFSAPGEYLCQVGESGRILVFLGVDAIGRGDDELGRKLMDSFLNTLKEMGPSLWRIVLVNNGVKLAIEGAPSLDPLQELEKGGVSILVCGTCLTHFDLIEEKAVGQTTNMLDVVTSLQVADKVLSLT